MGANLSFMPGTLVNILCDKKKAGLALGASDRHLQPVGK